MNVVLKKYLGYADIVIYDNDIFHTHVLSRTAITLDQAKEINEFRLSSMGRVKALMLSTGEDKYIVPTKEAMDYIHSFDRTLTVRGDAFVIKSFSQRLYIKTAVGFKKMATPVSFFASNHKAIEWLLSLKR